jgi:hypothetical protein
MLCSLLLSPFFFFFFVEESLWVIHRFYTELTFQLAHNTSETKNESLLLSSAPTHDIGALLRHFISCWQCDLRPSLAHHQWPAEAPHLCLHSLPSQRSCGERPLSLLLSTFLPNPPLACSQSIGILYKN